MFTIGTAAYKLYSASTQVGSTLSTLSSYHKYVTEAIFNSPSEVENLHPLVKQNLDRLARRIQVLSSPLNYCLLWSQHRGSAVAETIHQSKEVLKQTYHWLHKCNKDKTKLSDKEYMLKKLDEHIREIDFCLQALNLALSIIQTTADSNSNYGNNTSWTISPSSLLTASNRIHAMHNSGGDVAVCFGQLFKKSILSNNKNWLRIYRRSALKIYRNGIRRSYELRIECNEYGCDSDDDFGADLMNESYPLTLKFDLTSALCFTTLSSLIIDLPINNRHISFTKSNINRSNLNKNDLIEDAFGWVKMIANQVQEQYIFVLKSGLDDWDKPLSSEDEPIITQTPVKITPKKNINNISKKSHQKQTSLIFLRDDDKNNNEEEEQEEHINIYVNNNNMSEEEEEEKENNYCVTSSIASLDTAVIQTKRRTHLGSLLAPGGDYDQTHITPQLMAYITRLAIYENDYTKPQTIHHTNSTFKKYNSNNHDTNSKINDLEMNESDNNSILIQSNIENENENEMTDDNNENDNNENEINDEIINETQDEYKIKQQQKIPAHLHASDEELYLFLRNPPTPPIPFYPKNIKFTNDKIQPQPQNTYKQHTKKYRKKSPKINKKKPYFAAPNNNNKNNNEVTITYINTNNKNKKRKKKSYQIRDDSNNNTENLELSISDENHMKYMKKKTNNHNTNTNDITPKTKKSMMAIKDATQSSLLENVDLTASKELSNHSNVNSPSPTTQNDTILTGNFANLSIDNDD